MISTTKSKRTWNQVVLFVTLSICLAGLGACSFFFDRHSRQQALLEDPAYEETVRETESAINLAKSLLHANRLSDTLKSTPSVTPPMEGRIQTVKRNSLGLYLQSLERLDEQRSELVSASVDAQLLKRGEAAAAKPDPDHKLAVNLLRQHLEERDREIADVERDFLWTARTNKIL